MASILLQHVKDLLSSYFTEFNDESFDVNLFSGQAALTNLLSYESEGTVPHQKSSSEREKEIFTKQLKAHRWKRSVRRAWVVDRVKDYLMSCLGRMVIDSTIMIKNLSVAVIIPVSKDDVCCVRFSLDSLTIDNNKKETRRGFSSSALFINKEISLRNLSIRFCKVTSLDKIHYSLDVGDFHQLFTLVPLNPLSIHATLSGLASLSPSPQLHQLEVAISISELQLSLQQLSLELVHRCCHFHELQSDLRLLKRLAFEAVSPPNRARSHWKFCLYAVLYNLYGRKFLSRLRSRHARYDLRRRQYSLLYLQTVLYDLQQVRDRYEALWIKFDEVAVPRSSSEFQQQYQELETLMMQLSPDSIAFERSRIDDRLLEQGLEKKTLFELLVKQRESLSEFRSGSFEESTVSLVNKISLSLELQGISMFIDRFGCAPCLGTKSSSNNNRPTLRGRLFEGMCSPEIRPSDSTSRSSRNNFLALTLHGSRIQGLQEGSHLAGSAGIGRLTAFCEEGLLVDIGSSQPVDNGFAIKTSFDYYQLDPCNDIVSSRRTAFRYQNLKKETSLGFLEAASSHLVGDLFIDHTEINCHSKSVKYILEVVSFASHFSSPASPHLQSKMELAAIAKTRQWMEFVEPVKVSMMACLRGLTVSLPAIGNQRIQLQTGPAVVCSGDYRLEYLRLLGSSSLSSLQETSHQISEKLQPFLTPLHLSLSLLLRNVHISFVENDVESGSDLIAPLNLLGQCHFAALPTNLDFCGLLTGLAVDSISVAIHPKVLSYLLKVTKLFSSPHPATSSSSVPPPEPPVLPRVRNLARVSRSLVVLAIGEIQLDLIDDSVAAFSRLDLVYRLLYLFANRLEGLREDPVNYLIFFNQIRNRLVNVGVPLAIADSLLRDLVDDDDFGQHNSLTAEDLAQRYSQALIQQRISRLDEAVVQTEVIVGVKCRGTELSCESLTYDFSLSLQLETCEVYNHEGSSLLKLSSTNREICIETQEEEEEEDILDEEVRPGESKTCSPLSATVSLLSKSDLHLFGEGGYSSLVLYDRHVLEEIRNEAWRVDLSLLSVEFDAASIVQIVRRLTAILSQLMSSPTTSPLPAVPRASLIGSRFKEVERYPVVTVKVNHDLVWRTESAQLLFSSHSENFCLLEIKRLQGMFSHYRENDLRVRLDCLRLFDLSVAGRNYRDIVWVKRSSSSSKSESRQSKHAVSVVIMNKQVNSSNITSAVVSVSGLRLCFLYRFVLQLIDFIHRQIVLSIAPDQKDGEVAAPLNNAEVPDPNSSCQTDSLFELLLLLSDVSAIVPRNSSSSDLIGLTVEQAIVQILPVEEVLTAPSEEAMTQAVTIPEKESESVLTFNCSTNQWERVATDDTAMFPEDLEELFVIMGFIGADDILSESDVLYRDLQSLLFEKRKTLTMQGSVSRIAVFLRETHIFTALGKEEVEPLRFSRMNQRHLNNNSRMPLTGPLFSKITMGGAVQGIRNRSWFRATREAINLDVIVDLTAVVMKLLFVDTPNSKPLNVAVSQAELYLLLGFWFDNFHETVEFLNPMEENGPETIKALKRESSYLLSSLPQYDGEHYFSYFLGRKITFELMVALSRVSLSMALDKNIFDRDIPSVEYLKPYLALNRGMLARTHPLFSISGVDWRDVRDEAREVVPIGQILLEGLMVQVMSDHDVTLVGVTSGSAKVLEGRLPVPSCPQNLTLQQTLLELSPLSQEINPLQSAKPLINYGLISFESFFDVREGVNNIKDCERTPLSIGIAMSSYLNWMNVNIFLDHPDLVLSNLDVTFLLSEFFSCYFRFEEFGSPSLTAFYRLDSSVIPYGGTDVRLVLRKPHISLVHDDEGGRSNLFLEAENGASYRYFFDTNGAVKTFYDLESLSMVLLRDFDPKVRYRGVRGSSGFGSGKTLIEFFNCRLFQFDDTIENREDIKLEVFSTDEQASDQVFPEIVSFRSWDETRGLDIVFPEINYLNSLHSLSKNFPSESCDMVISFEDIVMVLTIFSSCLSAPQVPPDPSSEVRSLLHDEVITESKEPEGEEEKEEEAIEEVEKKRSYWEGFTSFNLFAHFLGIRILVIDNTLGMHLPFFQVFLQDISIAVDLHQHIHNALLSPSIQDLRRSLKQGANRNSISVVSKGFLAIANENDDDGDVQSLALHDVSGYGEVVAWVESFNNLKKCWEPFVEPFACHALAEKTRSHGTGLILRVDTPFHCNLSGAIIHTLFDSIRNYEVFKLLEGKGGASEGVTQKLIKDEEFEERMSSDLRSLASESCQREFFSAKNPRERAFSLGNTDATKVLTTSKVDHFRALPLHPSIRVGFSLLNLTGQSLRYLQQWEGGKLTVQYLGDGERGLLNFVPSQTLMRNMKIVEEAFDVQQGRNRSKMRKKLVGNRLALQICGYRWIKSIEADELGVQYRHLSPVLGRADPTAVYPDNQRIKNVLKLMIEIVPFNQGRMMILRSVFSIRNECGHNIRIITKTQNEGRPVSASFRGSVVNFSSPETDSLREESVESVFEIKSKESLYLPISLLSKSVFATGGQSLGQLYLQPVDSSSVRDELIDRLNISPGKINPSTDPINLFHLAYREKKVTTEGLESSSKIDRDFLYISCHINPEEKSRKAQRQNIRKSLESDGFLAEREQAAIFRLPPFCYSIEILHNTTINGRAVTDRGGRRDRARTALRIDEPKNFTLVIHPPITIENLLPCSAGFQIIHATEKRELWNAQLGATRSQAVHTVSMEEPLLLLVHLSYCRASEGILIHQPRSQSSDRGGFTNALQRTLEGILEENESETTMTITLYDSLGQTLRLNVENVEGLGGQRHITLSCPFWIVNTSQFSFQIREEGEEDLTAGSSRTERSGKASAMSPVATRLPVARHRGEASGKYSGTEGEDRLWAVFPGSYGPLHSSYHREVSLDSPVSNLFNDLSFAQVSALAYLFNFQEEGSLLRSKGSVKIQLDGSDWSKSVSLLGVGVNQGLTVDHNEQGMLEIGLKIKSAPGRLARFTKIVRFTPRFIVVNRMNAPLKVCQVGNFQEDDSVEVEVSPQHAKPYHLPSLFGARKICLEVEGPWEKSVSFDIDQIGIFTVQLKRKVDLASIHHVNTRGAAEYEVELPPNRQIGIGFETDWGEENIVIKSVQSGGYGAKETDVRVGDVLLEVEGQRVSGSRFEEAMTLIKSQLQRNVCVLKLRTVEEKLRLMRESAFQQIQRKEQDRRRAKSSHSSLGSSNASNAEIEGKDSLAVRVELRQVESSIVILASELDTSKMQEYRIENQSVAYRLYYKQRGIAGSSWICINPGQSSPYIFEDPSKPHKILMHVGENVLCPSDFRNSARFADNGEIGEKGKGDDSLGSYLSYLSGMKAETATIMNLDEIGLQRGTASAAS